MVREADFEAALRALEETAESDELTRADLVRLFELRAMVHHALGNESEIDADLTRLATLEPGHSFGVTVPPALQSRFDRLREDLDEPFGVHVEAREIRGGFQIEVEVEGDEAELVDGINIFTRLPGGGDWVRTEGRSASIPVRGEGGVASEDSGEWITQLRRWAEQQLREGRTPLLDDAVPSFARTVIEVALAHTGGMKQEAAKLLGWGRNTLTRKLKDLGMSDTESDSEEEAKSA